MEKPFDLKVEDAKESIISAINHSGLPLSIINMILKDISLIVTNQLKVEVDKQRKEYNDSLQKEVMQNGN
jgi:hypothetical protein